MKSIDELVREQYGLRAREVRKLTVGAGSNTYLIDTNQGKFILKNANANEMNHPEREAAICGHLLRKGLPVSEFLQNKDGVCVWTHRRQVFHMQKFAEGALFEWHTAPDWLLDASAQMLGRIHAALEDYPALPGGIGEDFFRHMTPQAALQSYERSCSHAKKTGDAACADDLRYRMNLMRRFSVPEIRPEQLTRKNTHGDYFISQLICGGKKINAVIDWTSACTHPVVWEIMRSYVYAAPECAGGKIDAGRFLAYVKQYAAISALTRYDLEMMAYVFYYQIAVCDYYNQYYQSKADNRHIYLQQAVLSTRLLRWLEANAAGLSAALCGEI